MSSLVVVANRLPVRRGSDGTWETSPGGLVSALGPCVAEQRGAWIGWSGTTGQDTPPSESNGVEIEAIPFSRQDVQAYYEGFSNRTLWPLYHNAIRSPKFRSDWWERYCLVNERFAEATAARGPGIGTAWIHDYHLQLVPAELRRRRPDLRIGFFLHIPFPPPELFSQLPWRDAVLRGLLGADVIGFQTERAANNFRRTVRELIPEARSNGPDLTYGGRTIAVRVHPISIDVARFEEKASDPEIVERAEIVRRDAGGPRHVLVGADRLDYTKGIDLRLDAFQRLLRQRPDLVSDTKLIQVAVPSREGVMDYARQRARVERRVAEINGEFGSIMRTPVHYVHRALDLEDLVALYVAADVMLVTPLCDGMNLVAKEFVVSSRKPGMLVLSEFAGAVDEFGSHCLTVNPWDPEGLTAAMVTALEMKPEDRRARMQAMRDQVRSHDVHRWAEDFLANLQGRRAVRRARTSRRCVVPYVDPTSEPVLAKG